MRLPGEPDGIAAPLASNPPLTQLTVSKKPGIILAEVSMLLGLRTVLVVRTLMS